MNLKSARLVSRMTQAEVAGHLGVSTVTYGKMEKDPDSVTVNDAKLLSELFNMSVEDIFLSNDCNETYSSDPRIHKDQPSRKE